MACCDCCYEWSANSLSCSFPPQLLTEAGMKQHVQVSPHKDEGGCSVSMHTAESERSEI